MAPTLSNTLEAILARRESSNRLRRLTVESPNTVDFSSNDYLSLSGDSELQWEVLRRLEARVAAVDGGLSSRGILGSGGSRLLDGNSKFTERLEKKIAQLHGAPAGLLFNSAFDANVGLLGCVPQLGDLILYDEDIHASTHDGMRMSRARKRLPFSHYSVTGHESARSKRNLFPSLEGILRQITEGHQGARVRDGSVNVFICVEGIYSMDGSVADLKHVVRAVEEYLPCKNGYVIVDEAHSAGVLGDGRGLVSEAGLEQKVWARVHGFGKAIGCTGGIILCSDTVRSYLINYARTFIYTTAMTFSSQISIEVVHDYIAGGRTEPRTRHLRHLIQHLCGLLGSMCSRLSPTQSLVRVYNQPPCSPIVPIFTADPRGLAAHCVSQGILVRPIVAPTVAAGTERVRVCLHAKNTVDQIERLVELIEQWAKACPMKEQPVGNHVQKLSVQRTEDGVEAKL